MPDFPGRNRRPSPEEPEHGTHIFRLHRHMGRKAAAPEKLPRQSASNIIFTVQKKRTVFEEKGQSLLPFLFRKKRTPLFSPEPFRKGFLHKKHDFLPHPGPVGNAGHLPGKPCHGYVDFIPLQPLPYILIGHFKKADAAAGIPLLETGNDRRQHHLPPGKERYRCGESPQSAPTHQTAPASEPAHF